jgi:hypothetical protein
MTGAEDSDGRVGALTYAIDSEEFLTEANAGFFGFAEENLWSGADGSIGRSLWDFVSDPTMQKVQRSLLRRADDRDLAWGARERPLLGPSRAIGAASRGSGWRSRRRARRSD